MNEDKATRYHRTRRRTRVAGVVAGTGLLVAFWLSGASAALRDACAASVARLFPSSSHHEALAAAAYLLVLCVAAEAIALPLAAYRGYVLERRYDLGSQSAWRWFADHAKASGLGVVLAVAAGSGAYALLRATPAWWWLPTGLIFTAGTVGLALVAPVLLFPIFFRVRPLPREALAARLAALARRAGAPVLGVYEWHLGDRTRAANAALVGLGPTRRILVSDTLLSAYSDEEIEVILAHELAHHVHGDLWKAIGLDAVLMTGALLSAHVALSRVTGIGGVLSPADVAGAPVLLLAAATWSALTLPVGNALSRAHERRADRFALELTHNAEAFIRAMRRLGEQNLADQEPSPIARWLFHTHPPLPERVRAAREWMAHRSES